MYKGLCPKLGLFIVLMMCINLTDFYSIKLHYCQFKERLVGCHEEKNF